MRMNSGLWAIAYIAARSRSVNAAYKGKALPLYIYPPTTYLD